MKKEFFIGRADVIKQIVSAFHLHNIVVLRGATGSGKSTICRYIMQEKIIDEVKECKWIDYYAGGLSKVILEKESTLYIIDDFDGHYDDESKIMEIGQSNKVLVNTRGYHFENQHIEITLKAISMNEAKQLLSLYNPDIEDNVMQKVIEIANFNPAMLELMGTISKNDTKKFVEILSEVDNNYRLYQGETDILIKLYINLARKYLIEHNYPHAKIWLKNALEFSTKKGIQQYNTDIFIGLSLICSNQQCYDEAMLWLERARESTSSKRDTIVIINEIARIMSVQGRTNEATKILMDYLSKYEDEPVICAMIYNNLGGIIKDENPEQALDYYYKALKIKENRLADYPSLAMTYNNIAGILTNQKKYIEAERYLEKAYSILQTKVSDGDKRFEIVYKNLLKVQEKLNG